MAVKVGINGFGRIGRLSLRAILEYYPNDIEVVAINDLTDAATNALLFKHDSNYGKFEGEVKAEDKDFIINGKKIYVYAQKDPALIPWDEQGVEIVLESTGLFTDAEKAQAHFHAPTVKKVIISAPAKNEDLTLVLGVNEDKYDPIKHRIISNASCTTNCLAPITRVLQDEFGIKSGLMTTVHSYTNDQKVNDQAHKDPRRARAAGQNIIPTSTGAAKALGVVIPEVKGKLNGLALRVPTPTVSLVDLVVETEKPVSKEAVNDAFRRAAEGRMKGYLGVSDEPLVSSDYAGDPRSSIVDAQETMVTDGNMVKVLSWYDNEWGYSCRIADLIHFLAQKGL
ncbi:MAG TPA: type I glyceraldehyde-3-phosphate dehydrogenase [Chthonomonadaceae bacterium]|nr:type I glyceraldehyde-3-phosphate dehydrogenase [Chthonomonadaceae bacterium]